MKKIYFLLLMGCVLPLSAETVSMISYNPSRLGRYDQLKVADRVTFMGGLTGINNLTVTKSGNLKLLYNDRFHYLGNLSGTGKIDMRDTTFIGLDQNDGTFGTSYSAATSLDPNTDLTITAQGGDATFGNDSYIQKFDNDNAKNNLRAYAGTVNTTNNILSITGTSAGDLIKNNNRDPQTTQGFYLAGGDIPYAGFNPNSSEKLEWKLREACKGNATNCTNNKLSVQLLGYKGTAGSSPTLEIYGWEEVTAGASSSSNCRMRCIDLPSCLNKDVTCELRNSNCWHSETGASVVVKSVASLGLVSSESCGVAVANKWCYLYHQGAAPTACGPNDDYYYSGLIVRIFKAVPL